ncbi:hypothetical protein PISL3812_02010 [Talaromyces islandicus]|uniref:Uncharacterized protein n=1 Tax=Talaromyces islandicus TaxID=28573 RepID=A0A0U1LNQ1_TALIS|nr:hypothetical protein PISL3812_02010 [Talaromyces islandicus]
MSADLDGDSEMLSSSGSASPTGARTPTFNPISELSPPGSQTASYHGALGEPAIGSPTAPFDQGRGASWGAQTSNPQQQQQSKEPPGASWNNQRAQEEYARALDSVVDRDFSLQRFMTEEFGDPFDESDLLEESVGNIAQVTNQISFTPTAATKRNPPRAWERVPSTAFLARHKSRKIWKRFRQSMELLRERTGTVAVSRIEEKEFKSEINASANADYRRAMKRQRLVAGQNNDNDGAQTGRGRSFLETKWEFEIGRRRRKLVALMRQQQDGEHSFDGEEVPRLGNELLEEPTRLTSPETDAYAAAADVLSQGSEGIRDLDSSEAFGDAVNPTLEMASSEAAAEIVEIVAKQEPNLVRSALRMNSLDGEDVALLSEFLSRAQAKRAANAAMLPTKTEQVVSLSSPTVRSRRALEELDKNSPSPQKTPLVSTPAKGLDKAAESPTPKALPSHDVNEDAAREESSPSTCRRSTRTKLLKARPQAHSQRPAIPNQIPVRRANGTEFVFLQRTEAQELALVTRKNTRRNKGNAMLPRQFLQSCVKQDQSNEEQSQEDGESKGRAPSSRSGSKQVCWKDEELVEYAPETLFESLELPSPDRKAGKSRSHALPATPSKKVRRINMAAPASSNNPIINPLSVGTPIPKRKKLAPKPPSTDSTVSKSRASADTKLAEAAVTTKSSSVPKPVMQKASAIPKSKSKSLLKAPTPISSSITTTTSAGATPVAKRIRAKKIRA